MAKGRFKWRPGAAVKVMNSAEIQAELLDIAESIASTASLAVPESLDGYVADVQPGKTRAHAMVKTSDVMTRRAEAKHNLLLKAAGS